MLHLTCVLLYSCILLLCGGIISSGHPIKHANLRAMHLYHLSNESYNYNHSDNVVIESYISSRIDHFNSADTRTYQQRIYSNSQYYTSGGAIYIYIGGEAELTARSIQAGEINNQLFIVNNARSNGAMLYGIEHRYYGVSHPFSTLDTANLQYLTSQQALADIAQFIIYIKQYNHQFNDAQVIVFGGSYPGALSSWAKLKYPHLISASIASSAPVLAKLDFYEYDLATQQALGDTCTDSIIIALHDVEQLLLNNSIELKQSFGCSDISDDVGFLYILADAVAYSAQYTSNQPGARYHLREFMCSIFADTSKTPVYNYIRYVSELFHRLNTNCVDFSMAEQSLMNTDTSPQYNQRQWYYQSCKEFGYFQSSPPAPHKSLRSSRLTVEWHIQLCNKVFQSNSMPPAIAYTNQYYMGNKPTGSYVTYVNGLIDPWHVLSVLDRQDCCSTLIPVISADSSHCADLAAPKHDDPQSLVLAREQVSTLLHQWANQS